MIVEEFIQRILAKRLAGENIPFYDAIPTDANPLPCVNLMSIQRLRVKACVVECRANITIFSQSTTKQELYDLAEHTLQALLSINNEKLDECNYIWSFCSLEGTEASMFNPIEMAAAGIQFFQTFNINLNITIDKKCGDPT
jgi:hypothetical protein